MLDLSNQANVSISLIKAWEKSKSINHAPICQALRIAEVLCVPIEEILEDENYDWYYYYDYTV